MAFWIGACECGLRLPWATSLKDRRQIVRSIVDGARVRFNLSSADLGPNGSFRDAVLGFTVSGSDAAEIDERMDFLEKYLEQCEDAGEFVITGITREVFAYGDISYRQDK